MLLLGIWRNVEDLEDALSLPELEVILTAARKKEERNQEFLAAIQGIDLHSNEKNDAKERFDEVQRRVEAKLTGANEKQLEFDVFGLDIEIETEE